MHKVVYLFYLHARLARVPGREEMEGGEAARYKARLHEFFFWTAAGTNLLFTMPVSSLEQSQHFSALVGNKVSLKQHQLHTGILNVVVLSSFIARRAWGGWLRCQRTRTRKKWKASFCNGNTSTESWSEGLNVHSKDGRLSYRLHKFIGSGLIQLAMSVVGQT